MPKRPYHLLDTISFTANKTTNRHSEGNILSGIITQFNEDGTYSIQVGEDEDSELYVVPESAVIGKSSTR
jgi:hypothetical protein